MKKYLYILMLLPISFTFTTCGSDDDNPDCIGIECLPPATTIGAGTFGCLVNGEPFFAFGGVNAQYQLINGEYYFVVGFSRGAGFPRTILIESNMNEIQIDSNNLGDEGAGRIYALVTFQSGSNFLNTTSDELGGNLIVTNLDNQNQIVSGTFEFEILNQDDGQVYQITDGRFDSFYVR